MEGRNDEPRSAADGTPVSNRGVSNTTQSALRACVDWLNVTLTFVNDITTIRTENEPEKMGKIEYDLQRAFEVLGIDQSLFEIQEKGLYLYKKQLKCGNIRVLYDGVQADMGVHVQMSGQGCREYEMMNKDGWRQFFIRALAAQAQFSRLDVAIDDIATEGQYPYFKVETIRRKIKDKCCVSKSRKSRHMQTVDIRTGETQGETVYIGSGKSNIQVRFYEKDYEREAAGKQVQENVVAWNRTEIESRNERAQALALYLVNHEDFMPVIRGVLYNYVTFKIKEDDDSNRSRWKDCVWWLDFLDEAEKLPLSAIAPDATIEKSEHWLNTQVETTLGMVFYAFGGDIDKLVDMLNRGMERMSDKQIKLAEEYYEELVQQREQHEKEWDRLRYQKFQEMMAHTNRDKPTGYERFVGGDDGE